jgi:hypothetical protein
LTHGTDRPAIANNDGAHVGAQGSGAAAGSTPKSPGGWRESAAQSAEFQTFQAIFGLR